MILIFESGLLGSEGCFDMVADVDASEVPRGDLCTGNQLEFIIFNNSGTRISHNYATSLLKS